MVSDENPEGVLFDKDGNVTQEFKVILKHKIENIDPENPVNPNTGETVELTRTVTRTIEYKYLTADGEAASETVVQTVTFTRTATVDRVTGEVTYGDWTSENNTFPLVVSPEIDGYTVDQAEVSEMLVTVDSEDSKVVVIYTPVEKPEPKPESKLKPKPESKPVSSTNPMKPTFVAEELPKTGQENSSALAALGVSMLLAAVGVKSRKRKEED